MIWADRVAKEIIESGKYKPYWVDDMKTPSGRIHVGSLRGVVVHDLIYKALLDKGKQATFTWVFDDQDPMDALPVYLDKEKWSQYLGQPLFAIPPPDGKAENYARYFAEEFIDVFHKIDCHPKILWASEFYKNGKMNPAIRLCLDKVEVIRKIYEELYKKKIARDWYPFQVACPNCNKESTTKVTAWDGKEVTYECKVDAVDWTKGCGTKGKIAPFSSGGKFVGKLLWKVEWPVKWQVIGVTIEGAGKDHMTAGGSHDVAKLVTERVLNYLTPYPFAYEFFLVGGKKMSSSRGLGSSAKEVSEMLPPYLLRFMMVRAHINHAIDFDPSGNTIPDLFDEFDRCAQAFWGGNDADLARIFELSQVNDAYHEEIFLPRFRDIVHIVQFGTKNAVSYFEEKVGRKLSNEEKKVLDERVMYVKQWLEKYAPEEEKFVIQSHLPEAAKNLSDNQKKYLARLAGKIEYVENPEQLQQVIFDLATHQSISPKEAFQAIYLSLIGKTHGPKAGWLIVSLEKPFIQKRFQETASNTLQQSTTAQTHTFEILEKSDVFSIDQQIKTQFPSITVGIAIIRGVSITKESQEVKNEISNLVESLKKLSTEDIGKFPEIQSYRRLYKEMGVDWHSRRPSPEALIRRIVTGKGLYRVNTCVDAYNIVVMKNRVSVGAFDLDTIEFPTKLRFAREGEEILLLGDSMPTKYTSYELAYFDQKGGYNLDFNYRDAQRTMVTTETKNLWLNIEGIYDITRDLVELSLHETINIIQKFCGGTLELAGIVTTAR